MRVLWFTNTPSCYLDGKNSYNGGGWISSAEVAIRQIPDIELSVSFFLKNQPFKSEQNGVTYYPIPYYNHTIGIKLLKYISKISNKTSVCYEEKSWAYYLDYFNRIIEDFKPDIIHVWGAEEPFGLISKVTDIPVVLHIQGVLNPCMNSFLPPFVSWKSYALGTNVFKRFIDKREWYIKCYREQVIYKGINNILGRTNWDRSISHIFSPKAKYFHVDEILRDSFYSNIERTIPDKLTIVTTISNATYKGFDLVLKTAKILKENLNLDFDWNCYGNINPKFIENSVGIKHDDVNVRLMGVASSEELARMESKSTLYFHPSYIDNSPNSLCEAQILSIPVVSTNVGGISSLIEDGKTGFLVPSNDPFQSAYYIEKLFLDRELNISIGENSRKVAMERHDKECVVQQILGVYKSVVGE